LHRAAYAALGLDGWTYRAIECDEAGLPALLESCGPDWAGLSLTMPLKRTVLPLLDRIDPVAELTGGANTVVLRDAAKHGYNTDVHGLVTALTEAGLTASAAGRAAPGAEADTAWADSPGAGVPASGARTGPPEAAAPGPGMTADSDGVVILGAGATACSALAALAEFGLRRVAVAVRDPGRASGLVAVAERLGVEASLRPYGEKNLGDGAELVLSTVPGTGADSYAERLGRLARPPRMVMDVVYHPWPTPLAAAARAAGSIAVGGFEMLLHQAARQVELMTGRPAPVAAMRAGGLTELTRRAAG
jgi:shikimate dehydrogenase